MNKKKISIIIITVFLALTAGVVAIVATRKPAQPVVVEESSESIEESSEEASSEEESSEEESSEEESSEESSEEEPEEPEEVNEYVLPEGYVYSQYTGLPVPEEVAYQRPFAVMLNNVKEANPQSGTSGADIIYEIEVEGKITRYLGVFQDYMDLEKIGSIRSARRYYLDFAMDQNAVLVHFGEDPAIKSTYAAIGCKEMDGMDGGYSYWRSTDRVAPHNVYTTGENLANAMDAYGYGSKLEELYDDPMFLFYTSTAEKEAGEEKRKADPESIECTYIAIPYSGSYNRPEYTYNEETRVYERSMFSTEQRDAENDERIVAKNVLIQVAHVYPRGDSSGHMDMDSIGEGEGWYICEGVATPVTWKKESQDDTTKWYTKNGERLVMVPGKTWISIVGLSQDYTME